MKAWGCDELSLEYLSSPEVLFQLGIIAVAVIFAWFLSGFVEKKIEKVVRRIHGMRGLLRFLIDDPQRGLTNIRGTVLLALWDTFKEHDINIPFPHREVIMRTPVTVDQEKGRVLPSLLRHAFRAEAPADDGKSLDA